MVLSKTAILAIGANVICALGYALVARYANEFEAIAAWVYFGSALVYLAVVVVDARKAKKAQTPKYSKISKPGRYRLTENFVGLAADPVKFFDAGDEFTVTKVSEDDSLVFIPEFGGWTFYEIPAELIDR